MATKKSKEEMPMETDIALVEGADVTPEVKVTETTTSVTPTPSRSREWMQKSMQTATGRMMPPTMRT
jgi:hypothetical protein